MKLLGALATLVLTSAINLTAQESATNAPQILAAADAKAHVGATAVVTGKIAEVNIAERLVRLNFDQPYPKQTFTAVIWAAKTNLFPGIEKLKGKTVSVTGKITAYREHPQIVLDRTNQLALYESAALDPAKRPEK